jgi:hypothetical protein
MKNEKNPNLCRDCQKVAPYMVPMLKLYYKRCESCLDALQAKKNANRDAKLAKMRERMYAAGQPK